ncbi:hypothetical protein FJ955_02050 [Mesorhizobium sp. B2-2-2]|uniref:hypothetical protein n=1 Tax=Mesorhizobium sp. B2-2-2 TaxID=2589964 RepID=UPI00112B5F6C|nr:hypothetical protein [Mesorhizobium sp. B2-2-2]TPM33554.1 hypothetical protein FJ955_02050 [Mesorhizobium sp. B2-2-2]
METLNQISLVWSRYPDSQILSVQARGLTHAQLRHYARQVGFLDFQDDDGLAVVIGTIAQRDDLFCVLESAGYEIEQEFSR